MICLNILNPLKFEKEGELILTNPKHGNELQALYIGLYKITVTRCNTKIKITRNKTTSGKREKSKIASLPFHRIISIPTVHKLHISLRAITYSAKTLVKNYTFKVKIIQNILRTK